MVVTSMLIADDRFLFLKRYYLINHAQKDMQIK